MSFQIEFFYQKSKCLSKIDFVTNLKNSSLSSKLNRDDRYCDLERDVSTTVKCDPKAKYRRIDGKCNNLVNTNWGSSFQCRRRLLPPDYSDGVSQPRVATSGSPLPNARLLSKELFNQKTNYSRYTALKSMFGQILTHDTYSRVIYLGGALDCCPINRSSIHSECFPIDDIPKDELSVYYKQDCIPFGRTMSCNTCDLGKNYN